MDQKPTIKETYGKYKKFVLYGIAVALTALAFSDAAFTPAREFVDSTAKAALVNLGITAGLKMIAAAVPLMGGFSDILDRILNMLLIANGLVILLAILMKACGVLALKILTGIVLCLTFFPVTRKLSVKFLIILLFINPGLPLYILGTNAVARMAGFDKGSNLNAQLTQVQNLEFDQNGAITPEEASGKKAPADEPPRTLLSNIMSFFRNLQNSSASLLSEQYKQTKDFLIQSAQRIFDASIRYLINIFIFFFVIPALYFWIGYLLVRSFFAACIKEFTAAS